MSLGGMAMLSLLASITFGGPFLVIHLLIDVALLGYLAAVLRMGQVQQVQSHVAYLPSRPLPVRLAPQRRSVGR